jgi:hypothetical protein
MSACTKNRGILIAATLMMMCVVPIHRVFATAGLPIISGGTIKTAQGEIWRMGSLHVSRDYTKNENAWGANPANLRLWRDSLHLNAIRLGCVDPRQYADGRGTWTTVEESFPLIDAVINNADSLGIYVDLNYHNPIPTWEPNFDAGPPWGEWDVRSWWQHIAPRYKDRAHVIYELANEGGGGAWSGGCYDGYMKQVYKVVRPLVPNKIIVIGSVAWYAGDGWIPCIRDNLAADCGTQFAWNSGKDIWGFHAYPNQTLDVVKKTQAAGVPVFMTEAGYTQDGWGTWIADAPPNGMEGKECMERNGISWGDWYSWNKPDQYTPRRDWLVAAAVRDGWAWWNKPVSNRSPKALIQKQRMNTKPAGNLMIQVNGRIVNRPTQNVKAQQILVLPDNNKLLLW